MLVIRDAQMAIFRAAQLCTLRERVLADLRASTFDPAIEEPQLARLAERSIDEARRFRLPAEADVHHLAILLATYCAADVARPLPGPALHILSGYGIAPALKLDAFAHWLAEQGPQPYEAQL